MANVVWALVLLFLRLRPCGLESPSCSNKTGRPPSHKGVYPQSDGGLAIVHIDASKGFVDLWVHLTFAIFAK